MSALVRKIRQSLERDSDLPLSERARKGVRYLLGTLLAPSYLRGVTRLGVRARTVGRPRVVNAGAIVIGSDLALTSTFSPVELVAQQGASLALGDGVHVNYGTSIRAAGRITIADRVSIGPYCIIDDTVIGAPDGVSSAPITIGVGAWLAGRVTVLPGTSIGEGAVITAGSIVSGTIPAGVVAGGIPARVIRSIGDAPEAAGTLAPAPRAAPPRDTIPFVHAAPWRGVVFADFTVGDLGLRLADPTDGPVMDVVDAPFCQTTQGLLSGPSSLATADFALVWTRPELALPSFDAIVRGRGATEASLRADVEAFAALVRHAAGAYRMICVPTWTQPAHQRGLGLIDMRPGGIAWALSVANARLMAQLADLPNVFVLDAQRWIAASATRGRSMAKAWYLGKVPFPPELFAEVALDLKAAARAMLGQARKLLVLDLDDTLWGGIVGDIGWENLQLGGHDGVGEAFVDFQHAVRSLAARGIVLGIVSKNTESVALEAIDRHPQMVLRRSDFVGWRINWHDKAQNIADLAADLNLGLQSVVFIDDNPAERARVRETLPEVFVPEWPDDTLRYVERLQSLRCFDAPAISREDAERTALYAAERERGAVRATVGSIDEWLVSLGIAITVEPLSALNLARTAQLLNKTNQMNLRTRRLGEAELTAWAALDGRALWAVTVADKFGSAGLTGILGLEMRDDACHVTDFVLSCRVMGRRIEHCLLHLAVEWARAHGCGRLTVSYAGTAKNRPCHELLLASALDRDDAGVEFRWDCAYPFAKPDGIAVEWVGDPRPQLTGA